MFDFHLANYPSPSNIVILVTQFFICVILKILIPYVIRDEEFRKENIYRTGPHMQHLRKSEHWFVACDWSRTHCVKINAELPVWTFH